MRKALLALLGAFAVLAVSAHADAGEQKTGKFVVCKNKKVVRAIRIMPHEDKDKSCKVTYSKVGVDEVIGQSRSLQGCQSILKNVQDNLESSSWKCSSVESAAISYGSEVTVQ